MPKVPVKSAIRTRRARILKAFDPSIQDAAGCGESSTTVEGVRDSHVIDTLANLGFTVQYLEDDGYYLVSW